MAKEHSTDVKTEAKIYSKILMILGVVLIFFSGLAWWAHSYTSKMVRDELRAQKIFFPEKGSVNFSPEEYPDLQKYAGQQVDNGEKAKAYANGYIKRHLAKVADGKVYAEVSAEYLKNPSDTKLKQQRETLFQGETLRGILLGTGFAFGTVGVIAGIAFYLLVASGVLLLLASIYFAKKLN
jgi:hypothetical protein